MDQERGAAPTYEDLVNQYLYTPESRAALAVGLAKAKSNRRQLFSELVPNATATQLGDLSYLISGGATRDPLYVTPTGWSTGPTPAPLTKIDQRFLNQIAKSTAQQKQKQLDEDFDVNSAQVVKAQKQQKKADSKDTQKNDPLAAFKKTSFLQGIDLLEQVYANRATKKANPLGLTSAKPQPPTKMKGKFNNTFKQAAYKLAVSQPALPKSLYEILTAQASDLASPAWNALPSSAVTFANGKWSFKKQNNMPKPRQKYNESKVAAIVDKVNTPVQSAKVLTPMISFINDKLVAMGYATMGPVAATGLPFYVGRWADSKTGRVHAFLNPTYAFDRFNYNTTLTHALLRAAYKWNQYVRSQEHVLNVIKKGKDWDLEVTKLAKANSVAQRHKQQIKSLIKSIQTDQSKIYKYATAAQKAALKTALQKYDYPAVAKVVLEVSADQLKKPANTIPIGDYMAMKAAQQFVARPAFLTALNEMMINADPATDKKKLTTDVKASLSYDKYVKDEAISPFIAIRNRGGPKVIKITEAMLKNMKKNGDQYQVPVRKPARTAADMKDTIKGLYDDPQTAQENFY